MSQRINQPANLDALLRQSVELYRSIIEDNRPADFLMAKYFKSRPRLSSSDRKFISETVYQTLRLRIYFAAIVEAACREIKWPQSLKDPALIYLLLHSEKQFNDAVLTESFARATSLPRQQFTRLRDFYHRHQQLDFIDDSEMQRFSIQHAFPQWITRELLQSHSASELAIIFDHLNRPAPLALRVNSYKIAVDALQAELLKEQVVTRRGQLSPFALIVENRADIFQTNSFKKGLFEVQDEGSQMISILLNARPNARVLDACAGAGGKTLQLAAMMKGRGEVFAYDINAHRLANIHRRIQRAGLQNIRVLDRPESFAQFREKYCGKLDGVIIDAPCSGSGTLRRSPDIKLKLTPQLIKEMNVKQREIINHYADYLKPGGRLVYATCSILAAEDQQIVEEFLAENSQFKLKPLAAAVDEMKVDFDLSNLQQLAVDQKYLQLYPHLHNTDGFFAAIMEKKSF